MLIADDVIVDPLEAPQTPARTPMSFSELGISVLEFRPGEAAIDGTPVRTSTGQRLVDRRGKVTTIEMILEVKQDADVDLPTAAYRLQQKFGSMQERESWLMRVPKVMGDFAGPILYKITGVVSLGDFAGWGRGDQPDVRLVLERDPVGYSTEETESETFESAPGDRHLVYTLPPSPGTAEGLRRIRVTNRGTQDWRGLIWAEECRDAPEDLEDPTAQLAYKAADLTPLGGAAIAAGPTAPEVRAVGTVTSGAGAISPGLPAGTEVGDLLIMVAESGGATAGAEANTPLTASGWSSPPAPYADQKKGNTRLTNLWRIATGSDPTTTNDTGDHQAAKIIGIKAGTFDASEPFNTAGVGTQAATKSVSIPGALTTRDNCLIIASASGNLPDATGTAEFGAATNASLTELTERIDNTFTAGDGGALYAVTGVRANKGAYGATTLTAATEAERGVISLAISAPRLVQHTGLTAGWISILSSEVVGEGHMTHLGSRRLWMRINDPGGDAGNIQLQIIWRALGSSRWVEDNPIVSTYVAGSQDSLVDLGTCRPQMAVQGEQRWEWKLMARAVSGSGSVRIRDVYPLPTEQFCILSAPEEPPVADAQKTQAPATVANDASIGSVAWTNPANGKASDNTYASLKVAGPGTVSNFLKATNFEFALPAAARPVSVVGLVEKSSPEGTLLFSDYSVRLVVGGVAVGVNKAQFPSAGWPTADTTYLYEWTAEEIAELNLTRALANEEGFGIEIAAQRAGPSEREARIDRMALTLYFTEQGLEEDKICFVSRVIELRSDNVIRQHPTEDAWGPVVPDGFYPVVPSGGLEGKPARAIAVPSSGDLTVLPDSVSASLEVSTLSRDGYHFARESA